MGSQICRNAEWRLVKTSQWDEGNFDGKANEVSQSAAFKRESRKLKRGSGISWSWLEPNTLIHLIVRRNIAPRVILYRLKLVMKRNIAWTQSVSNPSLDGIRGFLWLVYEKHQVPCLSFQFPLVELLFNKIKEKPHKNGFIYLMEKKVEHLLLVQNAH